MRKTLTLLLATTMLAFGISPALAATKTRLTIKADFGDGTGVKTWSLICDKSGGNHPNRAKACALIIKKGMSLFAPVPKDAICTEIYGGSNKVTVTGVVGNRSVKTTFVRTNGCEIARYDAAIALFPGPVVVGQLVTGNVTLNGDPTTATVLFTSGAKVVSAKATIEQGFQLRLPDGVWIGSAGAGSSCAPVTVTLPGQVEPVAISCTISKP